jgi:phospholipid/cholesterol/gamma-HCH transport system ATP-binding protein
VPEKSVILKLILGLLRPDSGSVFVGGTRIDTMAERYLGRIRADIGMLFQESALFDSQTVAENVGYRLYEETDMPMEQVRRRVEEVLGFVGTRGLHRPDAVRPFWRAAPSCVAIARAMAAKPSLLLLDDPTTGLDPITATTVDDEIVKLRDLEQVTSIAVTTRFATRSTSLSTRRGAPPIAWRLFGRTNPPPGAPASWCCTTAGYSSRAAGSSCVLHKMITCESFSS